MKIKKAVSIKGKWLDAEITTDNPASSYGQPVMVINGVAFGRNDVVVLSVDTDFFDHVTAGHVAGNELRRLDGTNTITHGATHNQESMDLLRNFIG